MTIEFIKEDNTIFAISTNVLYRSRVYDELMWAEIDYHGTSVTLRWEDDYMKKIMCASVESAKKKVEEEHMTHKPHYNGASYEV